MLSQIKAGDIIESPQGQIEVLGTKIKEEKCLKVEFEDGSCIEGTLDHKIWTTDGWVELQNLTELHEVLRHEDL
jgi:intein/homing endonuclease